MINTNNPFKSNLTEQIDTLIKQSMPTREKPIDVLSVSQVVMPGVDHNYVTMKPVKAYLNSLVAKKLLSSYGSDQSMSLMVKTYFIKEPHQQTYWSKK